MTITTMAAIPGTASHNIRILPARPARRSPLTVPAGLRRTSTAAAGVAMRFGLALLPVSALAGMFAWL